MCDIYVSQVVRLFKIVRGKASPVAQCQNKREVVINSVHKWYHEKLTNVKFTYWVCW